MTRTLEIRYEVVDPGLALTPKIIARELWDGLVMFARRYQVEAGPYIGTSRADETTVVFEFPVNESQDQLYWAFRLGLSFYRGTLDKLSSQLGIELKNVVERASELAQAREQIEGTFLFKALLPDDETQSTFVADALGEDIHQSQRAVDFILASHRPSVEALVAVSEASKKLGWYRCARGLYEVGKRLRSEIEVEELEAVTAASPEASAAWVALRASLGLRMDEVKALIKESEPVPESLVEFVGYESWTPSQAEELVSIFRGVLGQRAELDEALASSTYNVFRDKESLWEARSILRALEESGKGESALIASRALEFFERN
ncbi:hypothetical protein FRD01_09580 [Microvenator marinus]|uniref:Uncharacterized protein n=1 Tax=Microvenator marinus TaxID=2600177 RepID=A0A5B8XPQ1_9DELT|nr:hypothetical protein [Microvenator marinus]QED27485.1 hypothetical protein FRD01_09580 [Microvenator marinus]